MALRGTLTHRKTRRLAQLLGIEPPAALGYVEALFHVTGEQAIQGDIGRMSNADIAMEIFSSIDPDTLVKAYIDAGWIDTHPIHRLVLHDWSEHSDDAVDVKLARKGMTYADGSLPRMTKLSSEERGKICHKNGWPEPIAPQKATESRNVAQNGTSRARACTLPEPDPDTKPNQTPPTPPQGGRRRSSQPIDNGSDVAPLLDALFAQDPNKKLTKSQQDLLFDHKFYPVFWKPDEREPGRKAFRKRIPTMAVFGRMMMALERVRPEVMSRDEDRHRPACGPWINKQLWLDAEKKPDSSPTPINGHGSRNGGSSFLPFDKAAGLRARAEAARRRELAGQIVGIAQ